ncbi:MAG: hypothetical protein F6K28_50605, partial [Microcoleus sp. SIO2G3]|nr:hypothetical protein [Microcoleus sp. SIO2G3]
GDDDVVYAGALSKVLDELRSRPALSLLYLNFLGRHQQTGEVIGEHWFDPDVGARSNSGQIIFQHCIAKNIGSVMFITSTICRTDLVRVALQKWPESVDSWGGAAFWYGYCALHGEVVVTPENYVECTIGVSYWQKDPRAWFRIRHQDIPEVFVKLQGIGYPLDFCRDRIVGLLREDFLSAQSLQHLTEYLRSLKHKPLWTIKILTAFFTVIGASFVGFAPLNHFPSDPAAQSS